MFVPPTLRVWPAMVVAAGWNVYLSIVAQKPVPEQPSSNEVDTKTTGMKLDVEATR